jgi:calcium/calmodulin-dependent serine protein kinase
LIIIKLKTNQEPLEIFTYDEVVKVPNFRRKCLVLIGAHGVGRRHIKSALIDKYPNNFSYPVPYTSRQPRRDEIPGQHFNFVSHDEMMIDIRQNKYLEYGSHDGALYGTKLNSIREIVNSGKIPILDIEPSSVKILTNGPEFAPLVAFIAAPLEINDAVQQENGIMDHKTLAILQEQSDEMYRQYRRFFDLIIINNDPAETVTQVVQSVEEHIDTPQWIPQTWVY